MIKRTRSLAFLAAAAVVAAASSAGAQQPAGAPQPAAVRTPPAENAVPAPILTPPDGAVALCKDGTWIKEPGAAGDCARFGGLNVAMPPRPTPPPAVQAATVQFRSVVDDQTPPANATGRCKDGTWLFAPPTQASCAEHGGSAVVFPVRTTPPPPPRRP